MKNKNILITIGVLLIGLVVGALWGSSYGFTLKGPLADSALQSHASFDDKNGQLLLGQYFTACSEGMSNGTMDKECSAFIQSHETRENPEVSDRIGFGGGMSCTEWWDQLQIARGPPPINAWLYWLLTHIPPHCGVAAY